MGATSGRMGSSHAGHAGTGPGPGRRFLGTVLATAGPALAAGCASYPERTREALHDFQRGHLDQAMEAYHDVETTGSAFLSGAEAGTVALAAGRWDDALEHLGRAAAVTSDLEGRALVGTERLTESLLSWGLNDTSRSYEGEGFERVYLHSMLALAYLARGQLEDVGVEVRLSNRLLEAEEELYDKEYAAGGLGHFLSALAYELSGEADQAVIDYERMVEKGVGEELAGRALVRLSELLGREDELARWTERFGPGPELPPGAASIVVVAGVGLAPYKAEGSLLVPTPDGLIPFALPQYFERPQPVDTLRLVERGTGAAVLTARLEDVAHVAAENLEDRLLLISTKSVARGVLKRELTKQLQDEWGGVGRVVGDVFAAVSERADLRSWQTLPAAWHAARLFVAPGVHDLVLEALGGEARPLGAFELEPGETMVILARTVGTKTYAHAIGGRVVRPAASTTPGEGLAPSTPRP